jgi:hypothetical protein
MASAGFISFGARWPSMEKALVAIKTDRAWPMTLPNVARNVIAHEIGHVIGLRHNSDPTMLMCGRPDLSRRRRSLDGVNGSMMLY